MSAICWARHKSYHRRLGEIITWTCTLVILRDVNNGLIHLRIETAHQAQICDIWVPKCVTLILVWILDRYHPTGLEKNGLKKKYKKYVFVVVLNTFYTYMMKKNLFKTMFFFVNLSSSFLRISNSIPHKIKFWLPFNLRLLGKSYILNFSSVNLASARHRTGILKGQCIGYYDWTTDVLMSSHRHRLCFQSNPAYSCCIECKRYQVDLGWGIEDVCGSLAVIVDCRIKCM